MTMNQLELSVIGGSVKEQPILQISDGIMTDSDHRQCYFKALNEGATLRLSEGSGAEIEILSFIGAASWFIGTIRVSHDPFYISQIFQVSDINNQLKDEKFIQNNYTDLIFNNSLESSVKSDSERITPLLKNYTISFFNCSSDYAFHNSFLTSIPNSPSYWNSLCNQPKIDFVQISANLSLLSAIGDRKANEWQRLEYRNYVALIRVIEVWHQALGKFKNKDLFEKLSRLTNQTRGSVSGTLGNWLGKKKLAKKDQYHWTFDIPKILAYYELTPLSTTAIKEFKQRGHSFKKRYET